MREQEILDRIADIRSTFKTIFDKNDQQRIAWAMDDFEDILFHMPHMETYAPEILEEIKRIYVDLKESYERKKPLTNDNISQHPLSEKMLFIQLRYTQIPFALVDMQQFLKNSYPDYPNMEHFSISDPAFLAYFNQELILGQNELVNRQGRDIDERFFEQWLELRQLDIASRILEELQVEEQEQIRNTDFERILQYIQDFIKEQDMLMTPNVEFEEVLLEQITNAYQNTMELIEAFDQREQVIKQEITQIQPRITQHVRQAKQCYIQASQVEGRQEAETLKKEAVCHEQGAIDDLFKIQLLEVEQQVLQGKRKLAEDRITIEQEMMDEFRKAKTKKEQKEIGVKYNKLLKKNHLQMEVKQQDQKDQCHTIKVRNCQQQCRMDAFRLKKGFDAQAGEVLVRADAPLAEQELLQRFELKAKVLFALKKDNFSKQFGRGDKTTHLNDLIATLGEDEIDRLDEILQDIDEVSEGMGKVQVDETEPSAPPEADVFGLDDDASIEFRLSTNNIPSAPSAASAKAKAPMPFQEKSKPKETHPIIGLQLVYQIVPLQGNYGVAASAELKQAVVKAMKKDNIDAIYKPDSTKIFVKTPLSDDQVQKYENYAKLKAAKIRQKYQREPEASQSMTVGFDQNAQVDNKIKTNMPENPQNLDATAGKSRHKPKSDPHRR